MTDLDALAALEAAATPGPWEGDGCTLWCDDGDGFWEVGHFSSAYDAALSAALRNEAPALIDAARRVQAVEAERDELRAEVQSWRAWSLDSDDDEASNFVSAHYWLAERAWREEGGRSCCPSHGYKRERDEARAEVARLQAALAESREAHAHWYDEATRLRAALARIDTDEARQAVAEALGMLAAGDISGAGYAAVHLDDAAAAVRALLAHITDEEADRG